MRRYKLDPGLSALLVLATCGLLAGRANAAACGVDAVDARFREAAALCGTASSRPQGPAAPTAVAIAAPTGLPDLAPVSVTMAGQAARLANARRAVAASGRPATSGLVGAVAHRYRINPHLLASIVQAESGGRVDAVSSKGALGLMQVMPATARGLGVRDPSALKRDPVLAMTTGAVYLKTLQARFGNRPDLVLAAYNAGPGAVERARYRVPAYRETRGYVRTIMANYRRARLARARR